jgi:hypothetical protein
MSNVISMAREYATILICCSGADHTTTLPRLGSRVRIPSPAPVGSHRIFFGDFGGGKKPSSAKVLRDRPNWSGVERPPIFLSPLRVLSEAWESLDLLYKLFFISDQSVGSAGVSGSSDLVPYPGYGLRTLRVALEAAL